MDEKEKEALEKLKDELTETLDIVENLGGKRRYFYNTGVICVEMNKEEVVQLIKAEIEEIEKILKGEKNE